MIKVEARSPSPGQLAHTLAPPGRLRPIHPISDSSFRAVSAAEGPSDATLAALLDAAYKENHSLREEIRHREERERRILGLLLQYEQAVQKSGKEATTARIGGGTPSSGLCAADPRKLAQNKDLYHVQHTALGRPPLTDQLYAPANRPKDKENRPRTNAHRSEGRVAPYPKLLRISHLQPTRLIGPGAPGSARGYGEQGLRLQQHRPSKNPRILQDALPQDPASTSRLQSAEWGPGGQASGGVADALRGSRPRLILLPSGQGASTVESGSSARKSESGTALFQAEILNCRKPGCWCPTAKSARLESAAQIPLSSRAPSDDPNPILLTTPWPPS